VTDLPADFEVALQGVDTRLKALQPGTTLGDIVYSSATANTNTRLPIGTTGQVLAVVGGVPAWSSEAGDISSVTAGTGISGGGTSGDVTITNSMATAIDAKGDLIAGTAADTFSRLAVGTNGQLLTADSTAATGLAWTTVSTTPTFVGCSVTRTNTSTSLTNGALYTVAFTGENYDTNSFHDNSTNNSRITIPTGKGGKYYVNAYFNNALGSVGSYAIIYLYLNGSQIAQGYREGNIWRGNGDAQGNASAVLTLTAGDYIEMGYQQNNTETVNMWFIMSATYLGA
jgi:hypothetical protein